MDERILLSAPVLSFKIGSPNTLIEPCDGSVIRVKHFSKVDLPAPFEPIIAIDSPTPIVKEMSLKTSKSAYDFDKCLTSIAFIVKCLGRFNRPKSHLCLVHDIEFREACCTIHISYDIII